jgi:hypothetical protein
MKHNCIIKYLLAISLHFLFFHRNTWAQIKLDELKNKAIEKADKSISSLNINDLILKKPYLDSLHEKLKKGDTLKLPFNLIDLKTILKFPRKDSVTFTSVQVLIPKKNQSEYAYPFEKGDTMQLYVKHKSILNLRSVEVLLGKIPLYSRIKLKKKENIYVKIPAIEAGDLTIKMNNRNYFPIKARLFVRNLKQEKKVIIKDVIDTLFSYDTVMIQKEELQYYPLVEQNFTLGATLNLTKVPYFIYPVPFEMAKNGKGWAYWIGYNPKNINEFKLVSAEKDPLIDYAMEKLHFLPYSEPKGLTCAFVNESNAFKLTRNEKFTPAPLSLSVNNGPNYGKILEATAKYQKKLLYLACLNSNGISDQTVYFKSIYLEGKPYTEQVINKIPLLIKSFKIYTE